MPLPTILIAGGTGLIGSRLSSMLRASGYIVRLLSRTPRGDDQFFWNPATGEIDTIALQGVDFVINLAGAGIADGRWTAARKKLLIDSRVQSARLLKQAMERSENRPKAYLSAAAVGIYGNSGEVWVTEDTAPADAGFLVQCCQQWEAAAAEMAALGVRTVRFRIGVVLAKEGGALAEIVKPLRFGLGAYFGDGKAWWPWVHRDDVCRAFIWGIENEGVEGVFNLVSPAPARGEPLVHATATAMRKSAVYMRVPAVLLRLIFGEMSAVILNSNRVSSEKIMMAGFQFKWPPLDAALQDIFAQS